MLVEALEVIRALFAGGYVNYRGTHFDVRSARLWDLPDTPPPIGVAVSGPRSCRIAGEHADVMIGVEPLPELGAMFDAAGGAGKPRIGQVPVCWDPDEDAARARAHEQFRWFAGGWKVNSELPGPDAFAAANQAVRPEDVASDIPCGPDVESHVEAFRPFVDAGYTAVAVVQVGGDTQPEFCRWASKELLPALRAEYPATGARDGSQPGSRPSTRG